MSQDILEYIDMLENSNPDLRKKAIVALGKAGDKRALPALAQVYKSDPDSALRELARKAGRHIQKMNSAPAPEPFTTSPGTDATSGLAFVSSGGSSAFTGGSEVPDWMQQMGEEAGKKPKKVTDKDRKKAKSLLDRAIDAQVAGDSEKVVDLIAAAIDTDPEMEKNGTLLGLLAQATGMDAVAAVRELKRLNAEDQAGSKKRKKVTGMDWSETTDFLVEMLIWFIVVGLIMSGGLYFAFQSIDWEAEKADATAQNAPPEQIEFYDDIEQEIDSLGPLLALIAGFGYGGFITVTAVVMSFITWMVGSMFLGGDGLIYNFLTAMMRVLIIFLVITTVGTILSAFFAPGSQEAALINFAPFALGIGIASWTIGKVHNFGIFMGCMNMIATVIFCFGSSCACSFLASL